MEGSGNGWNVGMCGVMASALWYEAPGVVALRDTPLPDLTPGLARVRSLFSGISRGTERLVSGGLVPRDEWTRMRAPLLEEGFAFPLMYGHRAGGLVERGTDHLVGHKCFI